MQRREFITLLGGAAVAWPRAARAQQTDRMRRVGVLESRAADDPEGQARLAVFVQGLQEMGWTEGRNVRIDYRWAAADADRYHTYAAELVELAPDVILASASASVTALQQTTRTVPIVFVNVIDPVGAGFVARQARPGGNTTGFTLFEYSLSGKWLELFKAFARAPNGGLIVTASNGAVANRELIITLAARHRLAAVYPFRYFASGGLISYGPDTTEQYRRAAGYIDRILKGQKAADLPVQTPIKYELAINLKTAKALGLTVPPSLLARADQVIE